MQHKTKLLMILTTLMLASYSHATGDNNLPKIFRFHINGVNTSYEEAEANAAELNGLLEVKSNLLAQNQVAILYNQSRNPIYDIFENLASQKAHENLALSKDDVMLAYMQAHGLNYAIGSPEYNKLWESLRQQAKTDFLQNTGVNFTDILGKYHSQVPVAFEPVIRLLSSYRRDQIEVVLLAHSQGTIYANQLNDYLIDYENYSKAQITILAIGSVAYKLSGNQSKYFTADNDYAVLAERGIISNQVLPANTHLQNSNDLLNHSLNMAYLKDELVREQIHAAYAKILLTHKNRIFDFAQYDYPQAKLTAIYPLQLQYQNQTVCDKLNCSAAVGYYADPLGILLPSISYPNQQVTPS